MDKAIMLNFDGSVTAEHIANSALFRHSCIGVRLGREKTFLPCTKMHLNAVQLRAIANLIESLEKIPTQNS